MNLQSTYQTQPRETRRGQGKEWSRLSFPVKCALAAVMSLEKTLSKPRIADWRRAVLLGDDMKREGE